MKTYTPFLGGGSVAGSYLPDVTHADHHHPRRRIPDLHGALVLLGGVVAAALTVGLVA